MEFVGRVEELLQASLSREAWSIDRQVCNHCPFNKRAIWRCVDCSLGSTLCRTCMRVTHRQNPFHRIECWTGTHFRRAELWEVGTYLLVQHQTDQPICNALQFQMNYLETFEDMKDKAEQESANQQADDRHRPSSHHSALAMTDNMADEIGADDETRADAAFFDSLDGLWRQGKDNIGHTEDSLQDFFDGNGNDECEVEHADEDIHGFEPYLPHPDSMQRNQRVEQTDAELETGNAEPSTRVPTADALNNSYIRVVHTNGIHHLAMVTCHCQGEHRIPLELVASRLLPTSFTKIRTLFTVQVLDHFRLCNLELKASAYQFYQLIRRVTLPMRPAEVVNLYHELRRMSRLWRWMKRLKWIGYGHNQKDPLNPDPGSLANFCPACPQVGINIPENWKDDVNRWVIKYLDCAVASKMLLCYSDLFLNTYSWLMAISKLTMFSRKTPILIYGYGMELGWPQIRLNMSSSSKPP